MEISLPANWFILPIKNGNLFINYQEKLISIEPPFQFKNLPLFINNYNLSHVREEIFINFKSKFETLSKEINKKERIIKKKDSFHNLDKEEDDLIHIKELDFLLKDLVINPNLDEQAILNNYKSIKDILKHLLIAKYDTIPIYDFVPLDGNKLKCLIKMKDITLTEFSTSRNKNIAIKILNQRTIQKMFPYSYGILYKSSEKEKDSSTNYLISTSITPDEPESTCKLNVSEKVQQISENENSKKNKFDENIDKNISIPEKDLDIKDKPIGDPKNGNWSFLNSPKIDLMITSNEENVSEKSEEFLKKKRASPSNSHEMIDLILDDVQNDNYTNFPIDDKKIVTDHLFELNYDPYSVLISLFKKYKDFKLEESFFDSNETGEKYCNYKLNVPHMKKSAKGTAKTKNLAKHFASQILLKKLFPKVKTWGELVELHISNKLFIN